MVIDERIVVAGSFNYTQPANEFNDENIFVMGSTHKEVEGVEVGATASRQLAVHLKQEIQRIISLSKRYYLPRQRTIRGPGPLPARRIRPIRWSGVAGAPARHRRRRGDSERAADPNVRRPGPLSGRCFAVVLLPRSSAVEEAASPPAVQLRSKLALQLHQAPDPGAVSTGVRLDVGGRRADGGQVDAEQLRAPRQRRRDRPAQVRVVPSPHRHRLSNWCSSRTSEMLPTATGRPPGTEATGAVRLLPAPTI